MANAAELAAEVKIKGANEATKQIKELTSSFGFLGNAAGGVLSALELGFKLINAGAQQGIQVARQIDRVSFKTGIGAQAFQRLDHAFKQHGGNVNSLISSYQNLQQRVAQWKFMGGISQTEGRALGILGIDPSQYGNTMDLMQAITDSLLKIKDIGQRNMLAGILGIDEDFLRVAEKGKYYVNDLLKLSDDEVKTLNDWEQNINNLSEDFEDMFTKLGTMVLAGAGKDFTQWLVGVDQFLSNAVGHAKTLSDVIDNLGGATENRNWFGQLTDVLDIISTIKEGRDEGESGEITAMKLLGKIGAKLANRKSRMASTPVAWQTKNLITPEETRKNGDYLMKRLMSAGYSREFAAALVGGLVAESRLNPLIAGDNNTSFGIAQWHDTRNKGLPQNLEGQADFLINELVNVFGMTPNRANKMNFVQASDWAIKTFENPQDKSEAEKKRRQNYGLPYLSSNLLDPSSGSFSGVAQNQMLSSDNRNITNNIYLENKIATNNLDEKGILSITSDSYKQSIDESNMAIG